MYTETTTEHQNFLAQIRNYILQIRNGTYQESMKADIIKTNRGLCYHDRCSYRRTIRADNAVIIKRSDGTISISSFHSSCLAELLNEQRFPTPN